MQWRYCSLALSHRCHTNFWSDTAFTYLILILYTAPSEHCEGQGPSTLLLILLPFSPRWCCGLLFSWYSRWYSRCYTSSRGWGWYSYSPCLWLMCLIGNSGHWSASYLAGFCLDIGEDLRAIFWDVTANTGWSAATTASSAARTAAIATGIAHWNQNQNHIHTNIYRFQNINTIFFFRYWCQWTEHMSLCISKLYILMAETHVFFTKRN